MSPTIVTHLLVTTRAVVKGEVRTGGRRLQDALGTDGPLYLVVEHASLWELDGSRRYELGNALIRRDQVVAAHEYLDFSSDPHRSQLEEEVDRQGVALHLLEPRGWELSGTVRPVELQATRADALLVLQGPKLDAPEFQGAAREVRTAFQDLSYLIVNRRYVHGFFADE